MGLSTKIKTTMFVTLLSSAFSHNAFAVTGGLDYSLGVFNDPPAETMVTLPGSYPTTTPETESNVAPGAWLMPKEGQGAMNLDLGRIEYKVSVNSTGSYKTLFKIDVTDTQLGSFRCVYEFQVNVEDHFGGPRAVVASATANGRDSSEFKGGPGTSHFRCQVFPAAGVGPSMYIYSRKGYIP
jgi:hypothetical protein